MQVAHRKSKAWRRKDIGQEGGRTNWNAGQRKRDRKRQ